MSATELLAAYEHACEDDERQQQPAPLRLDERLQVIADHTEGPVTVAYTAFQDEWLHALGPSGTVLAQRFARDLTAHRNNTAGVSYDTEQLARWAGLTPGYLKRTLARLARFGVVTLGPEGVILARLAVWPRRPSTRR